MAARVLPFTLTSTAAAKLDQATLRFLQDVQLLRYWRPEALALLAEIASTQAAPFRAACEASAAATHPV